jgi:carbon monoxide dehydrogenase subunit G
VDITGSYTFNATPDRVWAALMNPAIIASCIPGCQALEPDGPDRYRAKLVVGMAAITGTYEGTVVIADKIENSSYRLLVEGQGKPGFVKGSALVALRQQIESTVIDVTGTVETGGPIARLGQRLIGSVSKMMQDRFFECLAGKV